MSQDHDDGYRAGIAIGHARGMAGLGLGQVSVVPVPPDLGAFLYTEMAAVEVIPSVLYSSPKRRFCVTTEKRTLIMVDNLTRAQANVEANKLRNMIAFLILGRWGIVPPGLITPTPQPDPNPLPISPPAP